MILVFWMLSFKETFSLSSFTFIKRLFSFSLLSAIRWYHLHIWGYWYFSQQSWLLPACASSILALCMMYSACQLNKHCDNIQPWHTPFPILNQCFSMSGFNCCFLPCIQVSQKAGKVVWYPISLRISSVQSLSCVQLFVTPWTTTCQGSLSITNSQSLLKLMFIELVIPSNHLILFHPLLLLPSIFPNIRVFSNESVLCIRWPKFWSFSFSISPSNEYSELISFRID